MSKRATVDDLPIGCTVRVVRLPKNHWRVVGKYPDVVGAIGTVVKHYTADDDGPWVEVKFSPTEYTHSIYRPWWLERGRVEWIPEPIE